MEIMNVANEHGFYVLCDEIYAEFDRKAVPTLFSVDSQRGIVTSSFTKAYGLGGLKLGIGLAEKDLVIELYRDVLNTVGNSTNIMSIVASELLTKAKEKLQEHRQKWTILKEETEEWLAEMKLPFFPNKLSVTYWIRLPVKDTYKWINQQAIPKYSLASVPGTFFLFKNDYNLTTSNMIRLGIGSINPESPNLTEALNVLKTALNEQEIRAN
jgi:aspartate/methionine/tyrosine aminotransferase